MPRTTPRHRRASRIALLLVDVINRFDFPGSAQLIRDAARVAPRIAKLAQRARQASVPVVYVNDHFEHWRSDFQAIIASATAEDSGGRAVALQLLPSKADYFVLKPRHSGFFHTTLSPLLEDLGVNTVVLAGFATNYCVLFTANDAYMHGFDVIVPNDCTASNTPALTRAALTHVRANLRGRTPASRTVRFARTR
jgi:nicotinamidase-related amidase